MSDTSNPEDVTESVRETARRILQSNEYKLFAKRLGTGKRLVETWFQAREGGVFSQMAAGAASVGIVLEALGEVTNEGEDWWGALRTRGYNGSGLTYKTERFIGKLLMESGAPREESKLDDTTTLIEWPGIMAGVWDKDDKGWYIGPWPKDGDRKVIQDCIRSIAWSGMSTDLLLTLAGDAVSGKGHHSTSSYTFTIEGLPDEHDYVGVPDPDELCNRFKKGWSDGGRFILLVGPTGSGKSTLARMIAHQMRPNVGLLKVSSAFLKTASEQDLLDMVDILDPGAILLDDIHTFFADEEMMLALMDRCHERNMLVLGTYMLDEMLTMSQDSLEDGSLYSPGMRPGRIDEMVLLFAPDDEQREKVLSHYLQDVDLPDGVVKKTKGLTPAYLKELALRIRRHGVDSWEKEVQSLRVFAPKSGVPEDEEESAEVVIKGPGPMSRFWKWLLSLVGAQPIEEKEDE